MSKDLDDFMLSTMKADFTTQAKEQGTTALTLDDLNAAVCRIKRAEGHFLVLTTEAIPDNCYGIIYLRKEDSDKVKLRKKLSVRVDEGK